MSHFKRLRLLNVKCSYLDEDGKQCNQRAVWKMDYHGSPEIYDFPHWVKVYWCHEHALRHGLKDT